MLPTFSSDTLIWRFSLNPPVFHSVVVLHFVGQTFIVSNSTITIITHIALYHITINELAALHIININMTNQNNKKGLRQMHTSTLKHFTPNRPQYDYRHLHTHIHPHHDTYTNTWAWPHHHTHTHSIPPPIPHNAAEEATAAGSPVSPIVLQPPPPPPPPTGVNLKNPVKAVQRRCVLRPDLKAVTGVIIIITVTIVLHTLQMRLYSLCLPRHITCLKDGVIRFVLWRLPRHQHHRVDLLN